MNNTVNVPAHVLQDLIFNAQLAAVGKGEMENAIERQSGILQAHIDQQVGNSNTVYGRPDTPEVDSAALLNELLGTSDAPAVEVEHLSFDDPKVVSLFGARA